MSPPKNIKRSLLINHSNSSFESFMSKVAKKCFLFFKILKGVKNFQWTDECQQTFESLKKYLESPLLITQPTEKEELFLYLAVSEKAIKSIMVREVDSKHHLVYNVTKVQNDAKSSYTQIEKVAYTIVVSTRKLKLYFQAHTVKVLMNHPSAKYSRNSMF